MKKIKDMTIAELMDDIASNNPAPGGGSAAALMGAMAAALTAFVCRLTIGREKYADVEEEMKDILTESEKLKIRLLDLAEEDKQAFLAAREAKYSPESLKKATDVPAETARLANSVYVLASIVLKKGNKNALTDAQIAVDLAQAASGGALLNVMANQK